MRTQRSNQAGFTIIELMIAMTVLAVLLTMGSFLLVQIGKLYSKGVNTSNAQNASRNLIANVASSLQFSGTEPKICLVDDQPFDYGSKVTCAVETYEPTTAPGIKVHSYCLGTTRYSYIINAKLTDATDPSQDVSKHVLWQDTMTSDDSCHPVDITGSDLSKCLPTPGTTPCNSVSGSGKELVPKNARLTRFLIQPRPSTDGDLYGIDVWLAYGDLDLLNLVYTDDVSPTGVPADCTAGNGANPACAGHVRCKGGVGQEYCATSNLSTTITRRL